MRKLGAPEVDCDPRAVAAKCRFAINNGYGGAMVWGLQKDRKKYGVSQPCHDTLSHYNPGLNTGSFARGAGTGASIFSICSNGCGAKSVRFSTAPDHGANASVSVGVYDVKGALVSTLFQGRVLRHGTHTVPFNSSIKAGTYVVKLTAQGVTQTAKATILK